MIIYLGADHRGFNLKESLKNYLQNKGYEAVDLGNFRYEEGDDYVDFAEKVARKISLEYEFNRGILICGSGVGVCMVANKFPRVRAALIFSSDQAYDSRYDDDTNVLCLAADFVDFEKVKNILNVWLKTPFSNEPRHLRRLERLSRIENLNFKDFDRELTNGF